MFTGIIEEVGTVSHVAPLGNGRIFRFTAHDTLKGLEIGESVAVDGVCLTVTRIEADWFEVQSVASTLERTTLGEFEIGRRANLERALALGERLGGHLVQGHVDATGEVQSVEPRDELVLIEFTIPAIVESVTILHGSITMNGVSLTVNGLPSPGLAQVSIIPHTWQVTALSDLTPGANVNLEGDLIGKYVRHLTQVHR